MSPLQWAGLTVFVWFLLGLGFVVVLAVIVDAYQRRQEGVWRDDRTFADYPDQTDPFVEGGPVQGPQAVEWEGGVHPWQRGAWQAWHEMGDDS